MIRALLSHNPVLIFSKILSPMFIDQSSKNTEKPASIKSVAMALEKAKSTEEHDFFFGRQMLQATVFIQFAINIR